MEKYTLELNAHGNVNGIPEGWTAVSETVAQLKSAKIPHYKACIGFEKSGRYCKPLLTNIIPIAYKGVLTKWKNAKNPSKKLTDDEKKEAWCKRLHKLTGCGIDIAREIAEEKIDYKFNKIAEMQNRQHSHGLSRKRDQLINKMQRENPLRRIEDKAHAEAILAAHARHAETDYDARLAYVHELEDMGILEKGNAKEIARSGDPILG